ncbi:alcohol dehydrogenase catalytic domain-containing protein [Pseudomonas sp. RIT-PI-AD]|uniref:zinc-dependent alcohol dehydrogenase n=1 Tax=Pseudomonas sp. RIT-PI-AD TaxID=3035294 RepID=UPI0021DAD9AE|nr:alcohol dehydrogenase catalytic domain-containing protein [Pseudomonas sp. RIT-PI-AD]
MKALVLNGSNALELKDHLTPEIRQDDDVIVKVVQTGICGTDRSILVGKFSAKAGTILGHESVGVVEAVGRQVTSLVPGQRVIINPTLYCGSCPACLEGHLNFCQNKSGNEVGVDRHGAFAEYIALPARFCHAIPAGMSFDRAVMVEPLACALNNIEATRLSAGETLVVVGGGPMGIVSAMLALSMGARVWVVEPDAFRRRACQAIFEGQERLSLAAPGDARLLGLADVVVESVGNLLESSLEYAKPRGRLVIMGYNSKATATVKPLEILMRGLSIIGAGDYNSHIFQRAIRIATQLPLERIITARFPMEHYEEAFAALSPSPDNPYAALKVLIVADSEKAKEAA